MGFKLLSFVFAYLAAGAFSRFLGQIEPNSPLIQTLIVLYIVAGFVLSFALWTRRKWVIYAFICWSILSVSFMLALQRGPMQMPLSEFVRSLGVIILIQGLLGLYIHRSMEAEKLKEDNAKG